MTLLWPGVCQEVAEVNYIEGTIEYIDVSNDFGPCLGNKSTRLLSEFDVLNFVTMLEYVPLSISTRSKLFRIWQQSVFMYETHPDEDRSSDMTPALFA